MFVWWLLVISLLQTSLLFLLVFPVFALIPVRKIRISLQLLTACIIFYFSPVASILLLLATALAAVLETIDFEYRFALTGAGFVGISLLYPGLTPSPGAYLLLTLLFLIPFLKQHLVEWRRIFLSLSLALSVSFLLVFLIRLVKETFFGSVANLMRPALEAFGSLFTWTIPLAELIDKKTQTGADFSEVKPIESVKQATMSSGTLEFLNLFGLLLALVIVIVTVYVVRKRRVVTAEYEEAIRPPAKVRQAAVKKQSHHPLLKIASQLEHAFPRKRDETTYEWLERIEFPEVERNTRLIDGIEFSQSEPAYDLHVFRQQVRQRIER